MGDFDICKSLGLQSACILSLCAIKNCTTIYNWMLHHYYRPPSTWVTHIIIIIVIIIVHCVLICCDLGHRVLLTATNSLLTAACSCYGRIT